MPGRYATALFELANEAGKTTEVERDLDTFSAALAASDDLTRLVKSPVFSSEDQVSALTALLAKMGLGQTASNFIKLTAKNRRLFALPDMIKAYRAILADARGEVTAEVTSAEPLKPDQVARLKDELRSALGRDVKLTETVDPDILGGLIVKAGSKMVDSSLRTKLTTLKIAMKGTG
ncbi:MAG: F0F1 ATP synthase subunit delta [Hyphomicrobiales bacterium]